VIPEADGAVIRKKETKTPLFHLAGQGKTFPRRYIP
jgi:hypothetical protein